MQTPDNAEASGIRKCPWNKGKMRGSKPPLQTKHVWAIRTKLQVEGKIRELAMFNLAIDSKLRGCDLVRIRVEDVAPHGLTLDRAIVRQRKTGHPVKFELTEHTREALDAHIKATRIRPGQFLFSSRKDRSRPISTRQYARLLTGWIASVGLDPTFFGTHSLRRTKATLIYRRTGNLRAVQLLLGMATYCPRTTGRSTHHLPISSSLRRGRRRQAAPEPRRRHFFGRTTA